VRCLPTAEPKPDAADGEDAAATSDAEAEAEAPRALAPLDQDAPFDGGPAWAPLASSARAELQHQAWGVTGRSALVAQNLALACAVERPGAGPKSQPHPVAALRGLAYACGTFG
jgi:hypothetical protein